MSPRYKFTLAYDGTDYCGWQRQDNGISVQQRVEEVLLQLNGSSMHVEGAGRTDAGVHARGQVCHADLPKSWDEKRLNLGMNALLPDDIKVTRVEKVPDTFHARFSAKSKLYTYAIVNDHCPDIFLRRYSYHYPLSLDMVAINSVSPLFVGRKDFINFCKEPFRKDTTIRTVIKLDVRQQGHSIFVDIMADGFLYNMVRTIVGTLLWVGNGKISSPEVAGFFEVGRRTEVGPTAPACGLTMVEVHY